jgi:hypothetical protein
VISERIVGHAGKTGTAVNLSSCAFGCSLVFLKNTPVYLISGIFDGLAF